MNQKINGFTADTLVLTEYGYYPINRIYKGERVLTHTGKWQVVEDMVSTESVITIKLNSGGHALECAPGQYVHVFERSSEYNSTDMYPKWYKACAMINRYWGVPNYIKTNSVSSCGSISPIPADLSENMSDLMFLIGKWVSQGAMNVSTSCGELNKAFGRIYIPEYDKNAARLIDAVSAVSKDYCCEHDDDNDLVYISFKHPELAMWLADNFHGVYRDPRVIQPWLYDADFRYRGAFMRGFMSSGYYTHHVFKPIAEGMRILIECAGYHCKVNESFKQSSDEGNFYDIVAEVAPIDVEYNNCAWYKVAAIIQEDEPKTVYSISVKDDHSFVADGVVVHDCTM